MTSSLVRWEKDPFFPVAEEVQQSADRMESTYRTFIHAIKYGSSSWNLEELGRDLRTTLSTTKWQLEEFEKAARSSYTLTPSEEAVHRHREFIIAIKDQIAKIEKYLQESACPKSKPMMHLDKGECNELALFLSAPPLPEDMKLPPKTRGGNRESAPDFLNNIGQFIESSSSEANDSKKSHGHRKVASAADIGAWKIAIVNDGLQQNSSNGKPPITPRRVPSTGALSCTEFVVGKGNLSKNGNRKWKATSRHQQSDAELLRRPPELAGGDEESYEKNNGFVSCDDKQLNGEYGAVERRIQRPQYQIKNSRSFPIIVSVFFFICLIVNMKSTQDFGPTIYSWWRVIWSKVLDEYMLCIVYAFTGGYAWLRPGSR